MRSKQIIKSFIILLFAILSLSISACSNESEIEIDSELKSVGSERELKKLLKKSNNFFDNFFGGLFGSINKADSIAPEDANGDDKSADATHTKNNVQVEGVDEGDTVKTDGNRIYTISYDGLRVVEVKDNGSLELLLHKSLIINEAKNNNNNTYFSDIYITSKYLVVTGQKLTYYIPVNDGINDKFNGDVSIEPDYFGYTSSNSIVYVYDIETLEEVSYYEISGHIQTSRLINDNLYLFSNYYGSYNTKDNDPRPFEFIDGEINYFDYEDIKYLPDTTYQSFSIITNVNLGTEITYENDIYLGVSYWSTIYVTKNAIYYVANYYSSTTFGETTNGMILSYLINEGEITFGGAGGFNGSILNQFSIDEYNGYLRLATTEGRGESAKNRLYIFERILKDNKYTLKIVGSLFEGIGKPGETIKSVRFNKDIATIVTFLQTDPLYTIDLSNPKEPKILGELEIPGFSTYQHPWLDNYVIGIGIESDGRFNSGIKLSLFDISDVNNPIEKGNPLILSNKINSNYSEALYNHKAIMIDQANNQIGFTISKYNNSDYYYYISNFLLFDINPASNNPITIKYEFTHSNYIIDKIDENYYFETQRYMIFRGVRINNYIYLISTNVITGHNLSDFSLVGEIVTQQNNNQN